MRQITLSANFKPASAMAGVAPGLLLYNQSRLAHLFSGGEMKDVLVGVLVGALALSTSLAAQTAKPAAQTAKPAAQTQKPDAQTQKPAAAGASLGSVTLKTAVMADGQRIAAGTYQLRLTGDSPKPGVGQTPESERYIEFVSGGKVVGREVATVVPQAEIAQVADGPRPAAGGSRVDMLKGNDYVRVWVNRSGMNYILHLPPAKG
jgi:hypothetical protein